MNLANFLEFLENPLSIDQLAIRSYYDPHLKFVDFKSFSFFFFFKNIA